MHRTVCLAALLLPLALPAAAQTPPTKKGAFDTVIKQPTGRNGYEELVLAGDVLQNSKAWRELEENPDATLSMKRLVLGDRQVAQALRLLHAGLQKPVGSPREKTTFETLLPELQEFRALARLLAVQQYVFFADGKTSDALANAQLGLRLGQVVQTDTLISGLVGISIEAVCIAPVGAHLDELSAHDTELLYRICLEWLQQPSSEIRLLEGERQAVFNSLEDLRGKGGDRLVNSLGIDPAPKPDDSDQVRKGRQVAAELRSLNPAAVDQLYSDAVKYLNRYYEKLFEELRRPVTQRTYPKIDDDGSLASRLADQLIPAMTGVGNAYAKDQAKVRVLACHAAVLRYRWEHNRVPKSLDELNLGELALDPFTRMPLEYQPLGHRYRLVSVGPETSPDNPQAVNGRIPVSVTPGD